MPNKKACNICYSTNCNLTEKMEEKRKGEAKKRRDRYVDRVLKDLRSEMGKSDVKEIDYN